MIQHQTNEKDHCITMKIKFSLQVDLSNVNKRGINIVTIIDHHLFSKFSRCQPFLKHSHTKKAVNFNRIWDTARFFLANSICKMASDIHENLTLSLANQTKYVCFRCISIFIYWVLQKLNINSKKVLLDF